ncbi:uncharacterized protein MONOS_16797 [Monocercomonoides exilis]|uniref:uncharacterized protein n=1 Tax=Monocercomonoides exilis TaxID=2049356 RepID=UPI00355ACC9C|nr:hypothetical protein MONOS_16797 [Monocercomonoides exilis]|eukprot:MONOS_16797.1-p1 / transcript=MONOS_16797.1 / gene=MONOS_16797 / organism=Monocercomonoides_exilis_PA203 / gene_product=unspecified product / transcript_product=unspecified product / location=Mono_scaffold02147:79-1001(-) / protein_length=290 / sequence_SO=supercontig / SO=protein_coding / is_pseudo=false
MKQKRMNELRVYRMMEEEKAKESAKFKEEGNGVKKTGAEAEREKQEQEINEPQTVISTASSVVSSSSSYSNSFSSSSSSSSSHLRSTTPHLQSAGAIELSASSCSSFTSHSSDNHINTNITSTSSLPPSDRTSLSNSLNSTPSAPVRVLLSYSPSSPLDSPAQTPTTARRRLSAQRLQHRPSSSLLLPLTLLLLPLTLLLLPLTLPLSLTLPSFSSSSFFFFFFLLFLPSFTSSITQNWLIFTSKKTCHLEMLKELKEKGYCEGSEVEYAGVVKSETGDEDVVEEEGVG